MHNAEKLIAQTKKWITDVVVGCNFCPFAGRELQQNSIHYEVSSSTDLPAILEAFLLECERLNTQPVETSLLILPAAVPGFNGYLQLVALAEKLLKKYKYEGVYQVAGFHPLYAFSGAPAGDAANYTNRSPYPMLHLLREASVEKALKQYPHPEQIPARNIAFAREKGAAYFQLLRSYCLAI